MFDLPQILAARSSSPDGRWIVGVIVFVIWAIGSAIGSVNKKLERQRRDEAKRLLMQGGAPPTIAVPIAPTITLAPQIQMRVPSPAAPKKRPRIVAKPASAASSTVRAATVRAPAAQAAPVSSPVINQIFEPSAPQRAPSVTATALRGWLTPRTLQQQFVLTEIFQPPVALRAERFG